MGTTIYNVETRVGKNGKTYIMEVSPRGGGNRLAEMIRYSTGVDLITNAIRAAVGMPIENLVQRPYKGHWAEIILHTDKDGQFDELKIDPEFFAKHVHEVDMWVNRGDIVSSFRAGNDMIGTLVLKFDNDEELNNALTKQAEWISVIVK
jgi:biotin carboxylase